MMDVKFLSYQQLCTSNDRSKYDGFTFKVNLTNDLYLLIKCRNNSVVFPHQEDDIKFAWCTKNEFPIASVAYLNCEAGYYAGIKFLMDTARQFEDALKNFQKLSRISK